jgi:hypothetical protein
MILRGDFLFSAIRANSPKLRKRGVYVLYLDNWVVYVGMSDKDILSRVASHVKDKRFNRARFILMEGRMYDEVQDLESRLIGKFLPIYNRSICASKTVEPLGPTRYRDGTAKATVVFLNNRRYLLMEEELEGPSQFAVHKDPPVSITGVERNPIHPPPRQGKENLPEGVNIVDLITMEIRAMNEAWGRFREQEFERMFGTGA